MPNDRSRDSRPGSRDDARRPKKGSSDRPRRANDRDRPRRSDDGERRPPGPDLAGPAKWGRIARGGAGRMESPAIGTEAHDDLAPRRPRRPAAPEAEPEPVDAPADESTDTDIDAEGDTAPVTDDATPEAAEAEVEAPRERAVPPKKERNLPGAADLERHAKGAVRRSRGPLLRERKPLGARPQRVEDPAAALARLVGPERGKSLARKLREAGKAFEAERFGDARALLRPVVKEAPGLPDGRELMGLTLYRMGRWKEAIDQLELFREMTDSTEQHPVLADCHRALGRVADVEYLWEELGEASPSGEIVTEGRIVLAGTYADGGDLPLAIRTLETGWKLPKRPRDQHLRRAYALGDLYDRAGKTARARELFKWVARHDPRFSDVTSRVKQLS